MGVLVRGEILTQRHMLGSGRRDTGRRWPSWRPGPISPQPQQEPALCAPTGLGCQNHETVPCPLSRLVRLPQRREERPPVPGPCACESQPPGVRLSSGVYRLPLLRSHELPTRHPKLLNICLQTPISASLQLHWVWVSPTSYEFFPSFANLTSVTGKPASTPDSGTAPGADGPAGPGPPRAGPGAASGLWDSQRVWAACPSCPVCVLWSFTEAVKTVPGSGPTAHTGPGGSECAAAHRKT